MENKILNFRARIHKLRRLGAKMVFIVFRQQTITIQGILQTHRQSGDFNGIGTLSFDGRDF